MKESLFRSFLTFIRRLCWTKNHNIEITHVVFRRRRTNTWSCIHQSQESDNTQSTLTCQFHQINTQTSSGVQQAKYHKISTTHQNITNKHIFRLAQISLFQNHRTQNTEAIQNQMFQTAQIRPPSKLSNYSQTLQNKALFRRS